MILVCFKDLGEFFTKFLVKSEQSDQFQPKEILQIIERVSYSIRYILQNIIVYH